MLFALGLACVACGSIVAHLSFRLRSPRGFLETMAGILLASGLLLIGIQLQAGLPISFRELAGLQRVR